MSLSDAHRAKFAGFLELIETSKKENIDVLLVAAPWVLGDNYDELITNLGLIQEAGLQLAIAPKPDNDRTT